MGRHLGVGAVDLRLVEAGLGDARFEVVGDDLTGHAAEVGEGPTVRGDPVRQLLGPGGFRVGVARRPKDGDKDLGLADLAGGAVDHLEGRAGVVDEHLLAGDVDLAHGCGEPGGPGAMQVAEPAVAVAVGPGRPVLLP